MRRRKPDTGSTNYHDLPLSQTSPPGAHIEPGTVVKIIQGFGSLEAGTLAVVLGRRGLGWFRLRLDSGRIINIEGYRLEIQHAEGAK